MFPCHNQKVLPLASTMSTAVSGDYSRYSVYPSYYQEARNTPCETPSQAKSSNDNCCMLTQSQRPILTKGISAPVLHHGMKGHSLENSSCPASMLNVNSPAPSPDVGSSYRLNASFKAYGIAVTGIGGM